VVIIIPMAMISPSPSAIAPWIVEPAAEVEPWTIPITIVAIVISIRAIDIDLELNLGLERLGLKRHSQGLGEKDQTNEENCFTHRQYTHVV
jgi:hypothetical protein